VGESLRRRYFKRRIGTTATVLVEQPRAGRCPDYAPVSLSFEASASEMVSVHITGATNDYLVGGRTS
jgi:tRNA A37 methylthiotransferase MiaB